MNNKIVVILACLILTGCSISEYEVEHTYIESKVMSPQNGIADAWDEGHSIKWHIGM